MSALIISLGASLLMIFPCLIPAGVAVYYEKWHEKRTQRQDLQTEVEGSTGTGSQTVFDSSLWTG